MKGNKNKTQRANPAGLVSRFVLMLAIAAHPLVGAAYLPGDEDGGALKPSVQTVCRGQTSNSMVFAGYSQEGCELVGWFDHYECTPDGGRYTHSTRVVLPINDCIPPGGISNG